MSSYLGIEPTDRPDYYFVSYNSEDAQRLTPLMQQLVHYDIPLWYDHGLEYGKQWRNEIANRIQECQAVILFVTKSLLAKENSYVTVEYEMATEYFDKTVYVILVDDITKADVPNARLSWWIDVSHKQSLVLSRFPSEDKLMAEIRKMLKISTLEDRIDTIMEQYASLALAGEKEKAERLLRAVFRGKELQTNAGIMARLYSAGYAGLTVTSGRQDSITIDGMTFEASATTIFHRSGLGDADVIHLTRNGERFFTIPSLVDACDGELFYDREEDLLYVMYISYPNVPSHHEDADLRCLSVCIVERPTKEAVCHNYLHKILQAYKPNF